MLPSIDAYSFGRMVIGGREYRSDLIIYPDGRIVDEWWRASGHRLRLDDLQSLLKASPEIIVAGCGSSGMLRPDPNLSNQLRDQSIRFFSAPSTEAVDIYNRLIQSDSMVGAGFHLTC